MTKTRRQMAEYIKQVDAVCEVVDARIPQVSRNPDMDEIAAGKPRMMILNRIDLADPNMTAVWAKHFREQGMAVIQTDSRSGNGTQAFSGAVRTLLADKIAQWNEKGLVGKSVRVMVVGIPNVGKSTFINRILGRKSAKAADTVYLATDPDREGEAISWHLKSLLNLPDDKTKRVTFNEITKNVVRQSIESRSSTTSAWASCSRARAPSRTTSSMSRPSAAS